MSLYQITKWLPAGWGFKPGNLEEFFHALKRLEESGRTIDKVVVSPEVQPVNFNEQNRPPLGVPLVLESRLNYQAFADGREVLNFTERKTSKTSVYDPGFTLKLTRSIESEAARETTKIRIKGYSTDVRYQN